MDTSVNFDLYWCVMFKPFALELYIYSSAQHLFKILIIYEPRKIT